MPKKYLSICLNPPFFIHNISLPNQYTSANSDFPANMSRVHTTIYACASCFAGPIVAALSPMGCTTCLSDNIYSLLSVCLYYYILKYCYRSDTIIAVITITINIVVVTVIGIALIIFITQSSVSLLLVTPPAKFVHGTQTRTRWQNQCVI